MPWRFESSMTYMKEHTQEWCDEMKKTCEYCQKTSWYCLEHEPWREIKSARVWGGMSHEKACPFLAQLVNKEAHAVVRYCATVQYDFCHDPKFTGHTMKCPECKGEDIEVRKGMY